MTDYSGGCHCGQVSVTFTTDRDPADFRPRKCQCTFCQRHATAAISDPAGSLALSVPEHTQPYRFGLRITDFHVCNRCGAFVAATWHDGDGLRAVLNLHALDDAGLFTSAPAPADFDGEDIAAREGRRRTNWMPASLVKRRAEG